MNTHYFITGGAGFIGSHLVEHFLEGGHPVTVFDNLSTGQERFLINALKNPHCTFIKGDTLDLKTLTQAMKGCEFVFHLSANADVRFGVDLPGRDVEQNILATFHILEAMRANHIQRIAFSSSASIYGEAPFFPTPEEISIPLQTSLYGASKFSAEALIQAYCEGFHFQSWIFRFVSILGERYHHGHVFDFIKKLLKNSKELFVLGDGHQKKSYLYVKDCIEAMSLAIEKSQQKINIFNLGTSEYIEVNHSIRMITQKLTVSPLLSYAGGKRGWVGDNPFIFLDCSRIQALGWKPSLTIQEGIERTVDWLLKNSWIFEART